MNPHPLFIRGVSLRRDEIHSFGEYPLSVPVIRDLEELEFRAQVTLLIGENGSGKSTLLEAIAIACGFNPEGGSKNFQFETVESHSPLHRLLHVTRGYKRPSDGYFLRAESFFNVATEIDERGLAPYYGGRSLHEMSHGESFFTLLNERLLGGGLYFFDEPEAALSPMRQLAMLTRIHELVLDASQLIIATHSPILMAYPDAEILQIEGGALRRVAYEETEHYQVTRQFFAHRERMLKVLVGGE
ncbi:MAG: AAA family ATPase [Acidobacteria bacterium]|nr:AAA family ATPase [Acidobacteriota bacterium]MBV9474721.1 AAA family ATPase [Acidobacteriota bacterium]